jgi:hypothetical protein
LKYYGFILTVIILGIYIFEIEKTYLQKDFDIFSSRLTWLPIGEGGNRFSALFTYIIFMYLFYKDSLSKRVKNNKIKSIILVLPMTYLVFLGGSRSAVLALILGILFFIKLPKYVYYLFIFIIPILLYQTGVESFSSFGQYERTSIFAGRSITWLYFFNMVIIDFNSFLLGYGPGGIYVTIQELGGIILRLPHNLFLHIWVQFGVVIMLLFFITYYRFIIKTIKHKYGLLISFSIFLLITEMVHGSNSMTHMTWVFTSAYGLILSQINHNEGKKYISFQNTSTIYRY